jgi:hypothetical protein
MKMKKNGKEKKMEAIYDPVAQASLVVSNHHQELYILNADPLLAT